MRQQVEGCAGPGVVPRPYSMRKVSWRTKINFETERTNMGRHLSNIYDHRKPDAKRFHIYSYHAYGNAKAEQLEWQHHLDWINQNEIGPPKETEWRTVEQLKGMDMIGIYTKGD